MPDLSTRISALEQTIDGLGRERQAAARATRSWRGVAAAVAALPLLFFVPRPGVGAAPEARPPSLAKRVAALETKVTALQSASTAQAAQITTLQNTVSGQTTQITTLQTALNAETAARKQGDADTLAAGKGYTDAQVATAGKAYTDTQVAAEAAARQAADAALQAALNTETAARQAADTGLQGQIDPLAAKLLYVSVSGTDMVITGANLHIVNGLGATNGEPGSPLDTTNLVTNGRAT